MFETSEQYNKMLLTFADAVEFFLCTIDQSRELFCGDIDGTAAEAVVIQVQNSSSGTAGARKPQGRREVNVLRCGHHMRQSFLIRGQLWQDSPQLLNQIKQSLAEVTRVARSSGVRGSVGLVLRTLRRFLHVRQHTAHLLRLQQKFQTMKFQLTTESKCTKINLLVIRLFGQVQLLCFPPFLLREWVQSIHIRLGVPQRQITPVVAHVLDLLGGGGNLGNVVARLVDH